MAGIAVQSSLQTARSTIFPAVVARVQNASYSTDVDIRNPIKNSSLSALRRGTGGRSSFNGVIATVFGASGFIGKYVCNRLGKTGTQIIIPYRGDHYDVLPLKLCGDLGQVLFQAYNPRNEDDLYKAVKYSNLVINLVGRDWETKNYTFHDVNVKFARTLARVCRESGVEKFLHMSHINAAEKPKPHILKEGSKYLATKWESEHAVRQEFPGAIIFKASDVYGQEDRFLRPLGHFWRNTFHWLAVWKKGEHTIKQPVYVSDLTSGIIAACKDPDAVGKTYQAVGPKRFLYSELLDYFYGVMRKDKEEWGYRRYDMRFDPIFKLKVTLAEMLPGTPIAGMCWDRMERECVTDNFVLGVPTLEDLGVVMTEMESQIPYELMVYRAYNYYNDEIGEFKIPNPPNPVA